MTSTSTWTRRRATTALVLATSGALAFVSGIFLALAAEPPPAWPRALWRVHRP